jgi:hypothetical protein
MIKYLIIGLLALASAAIARDYEGYDINGNHWNIEFDDNGDYEGHDNNGNHWSGHIDDNGHIEGHDNNGNHWSTSQRR